MWRGNSSVEQIRVTGCWRAGMKLDKMGCWFSWCFRSRKLMEEEEEEEEEENVGTDDGRISGRLSKLRRYLYFGKNNCTYSICFFFVLRVVFIWENGWIAND